MSLPRIAIIVFAAILAVGGIGAAASAMLSDDDQADRVETIDLRKDDAADETVATEDDDPEPEPDPAPVAAADGDNTGDRDDTRGDDGTRGGDNTGDRDDTRGNDGTRGGDNTASAGGQSGGGQAGGDDDTGGGGTDG